MCQRALAALRALDGAAAPDCKTVRDELLYLHAALAAERDGRVAPGADMPSRLWAVGLVRELRQRCARAGALHLAPEIREGAAAR